MRRRRRRQRLGGWLRVTEAAGPPAAARVAAAGTEAEAKAAEAWVEAERVWWWKRRRWAPAMEAARSVGEASRRVRQ